MSAPDAALRGGELLTAISTRIVGLIREHYGRGPSKAKTYAVDDLVICVLRDDGSIPVEQTLMEYGGSERVLELRRDFQGLMRDRYKAAVEELTGRSVLTVLSQASVDPDLTVAIFLMDGPVGEVGLGSARRLAAAPEPPRSDLPNAPLG